jgi:hypothetical protein
MGFYVPNLGRNMVRQKDQLHEPQQLFRAFQDPFSSLPTSHCGVPIISERIQKYFCLLASSGRLSISNDLFFRIFYD